MIQRIQSIYFFLAAVCFGILFVLPMALSDQAEGSFLADQIYTISDHFALLLLTILGTFMALISIFLYRSRPLQIKLGYVLLLLAIATPLIAYLLLNQQTAVMDKTIHVDLQPGMLAPLGGLLFGALAIFNIRKDEKLVKSMDRLR